MHLSVDLKEKVYMEQPPRYVAHGENIICRLKKVTYELKQSPMIWFEKFNMVIFGIEFARCHSDHSVFVRRTKSDSVILTVYVDDILLTGSDFVALAEIKEYLKRHFVTKDIGKLRYFLGIDKSMVYFYLRGSKHFISLSKLACWGANLLAL